MSKDTDSWERLQISPEMYSYTRRRILPVHARVQTEDLGIAGNCMCVIISRVYVQELLTIWIDLYEVTHDKHIRNTRIFLSYTIWEKVRSHIFY